jgi:hypothetical protein
VIVVADDLDAMEAWFVERGLPHFVERNPSVWAIWSRAIPLLGLFYVAVGFNALDLRRWSVVQNIAVALVVLAVLALIGAVANVMRGHHPARLPREIGPAELAVLVAAPVVPSVIVGQWGDALQTAITTALALTAIWLVTSYGVLPLTRWAGRRARAQAAVLFNVLVRALPLLLLFTTFLFINAEVWQVAGTLHGPAYVLVLAIFFLLGSLFIVSRVPALLDRLDDFDTWDDVLVTAGAPFAASTTRGASDPAPSDPLPDHRLRGRQRFNAGLVAVFPQAIQITVAAIAMTGFFVVFGFLAIPLDTVAAWTTLTDPSVFLTAHLGGRELVISEPLLRVAAFLGAFTGMYFTVVLSTDATYRDEFADDLGPELRRSLAVRVLYRQLLGRHDGGDL